MAATISYQIVFDAKPKKLEFTANGYPTILKTDDSIEVPLVVITIRRNDPDQRNRPQGHRFFFGTSIADFPEH